MLGGNAEFLARDEFLRRHTPEELQTAQDRKAAGEEAEALKAEYRSLLDEMTKVTAAEHDQVVGLGGLHVLGTERHEARRIDNQLRGRSGRQGDPGSSQFFVSLEDDLMRLFGSDMVAGFMDRVGMDDTQPLESRVLSSAIERAQKRVEAEHFSVRKRLLDYDDVLNDQRELIYSERREVLESAEPSAVLRKMTASFAREAFETYVPAKAYSDQWDLSGLINHVNGFVPLPGLSTSAWDRMERSEIGSDLENRVLSAIESRVAELTPAVSEQLARIILLHSVDSKWIAHLDAMDDLREGIGLRAYGQRDPLVEYKFEAHDMFESLTRDVRDESVRLFFHVQVSTEPHARPAARPAARPEQRNVVAPAGQPGKTVKVGRNDPCPCGSGKKYKNCCGKRND
jgi:preprotein translocase subunit SecA